MSVNVDRFAERLDNDGNNRSAIRMGDHRRLDPDFLMKLLGACFHFIWNFLGDNLSVCDTLAQHTADV